MAREITASDAYVASAHARKKVEMLFAHLKRILGITRLRLRGSNGAKDEFLLAATVQNLRKLAMTLPAPVRKERQADSAGASRRVAAPASSTASAESGRSL